MTMYFFFFFFIEEASYRVEMKNEYVPEEFAYSFFCPYVVARIKFSEKIWARRK